MFEDTPDEIIIEPSCGWETLDGSVKVENKGDCKIYVVIYKEKDFDKAPPEI